MIRNDFVSNSSSSSFIVVGYKTTYDDIVDKLKKLDPNFIEKDTDDTCQKFMDFYGVTYIDFKIDVSCYPYNLYFGLEYNNDESLEYKQKILNEVKKMFPEITISDICKYTSGEYN